MLLTKEQQKSYENAKIRYIFIEKFENKCVKDKKYCEVRDLCHYTKEYRGHGHNICNLICNLLSNLVNNLSEGIDKIKRKYGHDNKKCETCGINCKCCNCFLEYTDFKDNLIEYRCLCCNKNYRQKFDEKLK